MPRLLLLLLPALLTSVAARTQTTAPLPTQTNPAAVTPAVKVKAVPQTARKSKPRRVEDPEISSAPAAVVAPEAMPSADQARTPDPNPSPARSARGPRERSGARGASASGGSHGHAGGAHGRGH